MRPTVCLAISGATGFVGGALVQSCLDAISNSEGSGVLALSRQAPAKPLPGARYVNVGDLFEFTHWQSILTGIDVLVHTAARVHVMHDTEADPLTAFRAVNVVGTLNLARQAAAAGVKRFVFISSVIPRTSSVVDRSCPSLTKNVWLAAWGWVMQVMMKSIKLSSATRLRWLCTAPNGKGQPRWTARIRAAKLALTPCPYTSGGRMMTTSMPVSAAVWRKPCSASCLLTP